VKNIIAAIGKDVYRLLAFLATHNALSSLRLTSSGIGRLCSKKSTSSFEIHAMSASSCCVNFRDMRRIVALKAIDGSCVKVANVVEVSIPVDNDTSY